MFKEESYSGIVGNLSFGNIITRSIRAWKFRLNGEKPMTGYAKIEGFWNTTNTAFPGVEDILTMSTTEGFSYIGKARLTSMKVICEVDDMVKVEYKFSLLENLKVEIKETNDEDIC